jgi:glycosyltransferase involved in cell wall biosynthesis
VRLAFVVPRYGREVIGGGELHCRQIAERLAPHCEVDVLTTCALDYETWADHYPPGEEMLNGVRVRRFRVTQPRDPATFAAFTARIFHGERTILDEIAWMVRQGPCSPDLLDAIRRGRPEYDLFVFFIYLYFPTYFGLPLVPDKAVLVPLAHDEPPFHLDLFRSVFYLPQLIVYQTAAERDLVHWKHGAALGPGLILSGGVDPPPAADPAAFRARHRLFDDPLLVYVGRINASKGCHELLAYFDAYKRARPGRLKLVLLGPVEMPLPRRPDLLALGTVSDEEKYAALRAASVFVLPSHFESLSYATLEAWQCGTPALLSGASAVLREHCHASGGGLYYRDCAEFTAALDLLLGDPALRCALGERGRRYVERTYLWEMVEARYLTAFRELAERLRERTGA